MRTVHETEALRPSDPVPKSMQAGPAGRGKLKIIIKTPNSHTNGQDDGDGANGEDANADYFTALPTELFSADELALPVEKLTHKCHWESKWAEEIGESLKKECKAWEDIYYKEWLEKETILAQVIASEVDWDERRQAILSGSADVKISAAADEEKEADTMNGVETEAAKTTVEPSAA